MQNKFQLIFTIKGTDSGLTNYDCQVISQRVWGESYNEHIERYLH